MVESRGETKGQRSIETKQNFIRKGKAKQNEKKERNENTVQSLQSVRSFNRVLASDLPINPVRLRNPLTIAPTLVSTS